MGITIKPNQPLGFNIDDSCNCGGGYCQPIQTDDHLMLQGALGIATGRSMLINGEFSSGADWTLGAGWSIAGGKLLATNISGTNAVSNTPLGLVVGRLYLIQIQVNVTSVGSATAGQGWYAAVNDNYLQLPNSIPSGDGHNASLTASWIYSPSAITSDLIAFLCDENTIDFNVEYVRVYELSQVGMALYNGDTLVEDITSFSGSNFLSYYFNGSIFMTNGALIGGTTNILMQTVTDVSVYWILGLNTWESVTDETGCLTVRIYDTLFLSNRFRNGSFNTSDLSYWQAGLGWAFSAGKACYASGGGITSLTQVDTLQGGVNYDFFADISGVTGSEGIKVLYSINGGGFILADVVAGHADIDLTGEEGLVEVTIAISVLHSTDSLCIDDLTLTAEEPDALNQSNCINLQTTHECTLFFSATNNDDAFGFDYTLHVFFLYLRLNAKKDVSGYPEESEDYLFSDNERQLLFARTETEYEINVTDAPDYIHACLRMMRLNDYFYMDGMEYIKGGNYDLKKRKSSKLKQSLFTIKDKTGISSNYSCS